jgi:hypothetical protein
MVKFVILLACMQLAQQPAKIEKSNVKCDECLNVTVSTVESALDCKRVDVNTTLIVMRRDGRRVLLDFCAAADDPKYSKVDERN